MSDGDGVPHWLAVAGRRGVVLRSLKVALVVGTVLALINHGDSLLAGRLSMGVAAKIAMTYLVPYAVATWSAVQTTLAAEQGRD